MKQNEKKKGMMKLAGAIVRNRNLIFLLVIVGLVFSVFSFSWVRVENDLAEYLPADSESKQGYEIMEKEFTSFGSAEIMVANITLKDAEKLWDKMLEVPHVADVAFDDTEAHYRDAAALFSVTLDVPSNNITATSEASKTAIAEIKKLIEKEDAYINSQIGVNYSEILGKEISIVLIYVTVIILVLLLLTSRAYAEVPVLLLTFFVAMIINMGTNFIFTKISFVSFSVTSVLQLALSLDYAVILCNRFREEREMLPTEEAAVSALAKAIPEIGSSCLTTIGGLVAMLFMQFTLGPDMGICLIKSIIFALLSVFFFMPGLLVVFGPLIDKTSHKPFVPKVPFLGKLAYKGRKITPILFAVVFAAAAVLALRCPYIYGYNSLTTPMKNEKMTAMEKIRDTFGEKTMVAMVVPSGDYEKEKALLKELSEAPEMTSAMGLANIEAMDGYTLADKLNPRAFSELADLDYEVAELLYAAYAAKTGDASKLLSGISTYEVPLIDMFLFVSEQVKAGLVPLDSDQAETINNTYALMNTAKTQLMGEDHSRFLLYLNLPESGDETYAFLDRIHEIGEKYYPEKEIFLVGNSTTAYDFQKSFSHDNVVVSLLSILIVLAVLLFTFKSVMMPFLLILTIQGSIWLTFAWCTLTNSGIFFMCQLVVSAIMMGANIDYAIVIASRFRESRKTLEPKEAIIDTMNFAFPTVITSGSILSVAGFLIGYQTSEPAISGIGITLGRGTVISLILVLFVLPSILLVGEKLVEKSSFLMPKVIREKTARGNVRIDGIVQGEIHGKISGRVNALIEGDVNVNVISGETVSRDEEKEA